MSGLDGTPLVLDRELVARVVTELMKLDLATRSKSGLAKRAGDMGRSTLDRVLTGRTVLPLTLQALDGALLLPVGTLEAVGRRDTHMLTELGVSGDVRSRINIELGRLSENQRGERRRRVR